MELSINHFSVFFVCVIGMEIVSCGRDDDEMFRWIKAFILNSVDLL